MSVEHCMIPPIVGLKLMNILWIGEGWGPGGIPAQELRSSFLQCYSCLSSQPEYLVSIHPLISRMHYNVYYLISSSFLLTANVCLKLIWTWIKSQRGRWHPKPRTVCEYDAQTNEQWWWSCLAVVDAPSVDRWLERGQSTCLHNILLCANISSSSDAMFQTLVAE